MASLKDVNQVADDLERLIGELRSELTDGGDFERLIQISDEIAEHADNAAQTFTTVNDTLMSRISELTGRGSSRSGGRSGQTKQKAAASS